MIQDIEEGSGGSDPQNMIDISGITFLMARGESVGTELFAGITTTVLPVEVFEFNGRRENEDAKLYWKTESDQVKSGFEIERSIDGRNYERIGIVAASATTGINNYQFTDHEFTSLGVQVIYYRLRQNMPDGRFTYSRIVALATDSRNIVVLYPNPATDYANLLVTTGKAQALQCRIVDNNGKLVKQLLWNITPGSKSLPVDLSNLASGTYYLELKGTTINEVKTIIKK